MINNRLRNTFAALLAVALATPLMVRADDDAVRTQFSDALTRARDAQAPVPQDSAALRAYVLYPYLEATRIQTAIATAAAGSADADAARWLAAHPDLAVSRELRRQWLADLGERGDWAQFSAQDDAADRDPKLSCYRWQARIASGEPAATLAPALLAFWVDAPQMPAICNAPFDWLQAQNLIDDAALEQRARKALADRNTYLAGELIKRMSPARATALSQWQRLLLDPQDELDALAGDARRVFEWPAFDAAFSRLARRDPAAAQATLARFERSRFSDAQYGELCRAIALGYAWDRDARALAAFQTMPETAVDERVHEWRIRAALWNGDWPLADNWLQSLPPALAADPRWTYWRARSAEQLGRKDEARALYASLSKANGYYGVLAAWRLDTRFAPQTRKLTDDRGLQQRLLDGNAALLRARELFLVGETRWADSEWRSATDAMNDDERMQAALLASRWGWHWQTVLMLSRLDAGDALDLMYPRKAYAAEIKHAAKQSALPAAWIYGVMRQESLFLRQAVSSSDALGLLQLKLSTARDVARRIGAPRPSRDDLFDAETNIALGSAYLRQMTDRYGGQFVLTVASYNAGPNAVARWLPDAPLDADVWIENVPYNETRKYVERIAWHIAVHDWQTSGKIRDFDELLRPVHRPTP